MPINPNYHNNNIDGAGYLKPLEEVSVFTLDHLPKILALRDKVIDLAKENISPLELDQFIKKSEHILIKASQDLKKNSQADITPDQLLNIHTLESISLKEIAQHKQALIHQLDLYRKVSKQAASQGKLIKQKIHTVKELEKSHRPLVNPEESLNRVYVLNDLVIKRFCITKKGNEEERLVQDIANFYMEKGVVPLKEYLNLETPALLVEKQGRCVETRKLYADVGIPLDKALDSLICKKLQFIAKHLLKIEDRNLLYTLAKRNLLTSSLWKDRRKLPYFLPVANEEYTKCEKRQWEKLKAREGWKPISFRDIHQQWINGALAKENLFLIREKSNDKTPALTSEVLKQALDVSLTLVYPKIMYAKEVPPKNKLNLMDLSPEQENLLIEYENTMWKYIDMYGRSHENKTLKELYLAYQKGEMQDNDVLLVNENGEEHACILNQNQQLVQILNKKSIYNIHYWVEEPTPANAYSQFKHQTTNLFDSYFLENIGQMKWRCELSDHTIKTCSFNEIKELWLQEKINAKTPVAPIRFYAEEQQSTFLPIESERSGLYKALCWKMEPIPITEKIIPPIQKEVVGQIVVKPRIKNLITYHSLSAEMRNVILNRLDNESIYRCLLTIPLQTMDLHRNNLGFSPVNRKAFNKFKNTHFTFSFPDGQPVPNGQNLSLERLQYNDYFGRIGHDWLISYEEKDAKGQSILVCDSYKNIKGTDLEAAITTSWQVDLFDTDVSMGENNLILFHPQANPPFQKYDIILPFRSTLLGTEWSLTPLSDDMINRLMASEHSSQMALDWMDRLDSPFRKKFTREQNEEITSQLHIVLNEPEYTKHHWRLEGEEVSLVKMQSLFIKMFSLPEPTTEAAASLWKTIENFQEQNKKKPAPLNDKVSSSEDIVRMRETIAAQLFPRVTGRQRQAFSDRIIRQKNYLEQYKILADETTPLSIPQLKSIVSHSCTPLSSPEIEHFLQNINKIKTLSKSEEVLQQNINYVRKRIIKGYAPSYMNLAKATYPLLADMLDFYVASFGTKAEEWGLKEGELVGNHSVNTLLMLHEGILSKDHELRYKSLHLKDAVDYYIKSDPSKMTPGLMRKVMVSDND